MRGRLNWNGGRGLVWITVFIRVTVLQKKNRERIFKSKSYSKRVTGKKRGSMNKEGNKYIPDPQLAKSARHHQHETEILCPCAKQGGLRLLGNTQFRNETIWSCSFPLPCCNSCDATQLACTFTSSIISLRSDMKW